MKKTKKRIVRASVIILIFISTLLTGATLFLQWYALQAGGNERGKNIEESYAFMYRNYPFLKAWTDSLNRVQALRDTFIRAEDGTPLHALYLYADTVVPHTAVVVHGYTDNAVRICTSLTCIITTCTITCFCPTCVSPAKAAETTCKWDGRTAWMCCAGWTSPTASFHLPHPAHTWWYTAFPWAVPRPYV